MKKLLKYVFCFTFICSFFIIKPIFIKAVSSTVSLQNKYCYGENSLKGAKLKTEYDACTIYHELTLGSNEKLKTYAFTVNGSDWGYSVASSNSGVSSGETKSYNYKFIKDPPHYHAWYSVNSTYTYTTGSGLLANTKTETSGQKTMQLVKEHIYPSCTASARVMSLNGSTIAPDYTVGTTAWYRNPSSYGTSWQIMFSVYQGDTNGGSSIQSGAGIKESQYFPKDNNVDIYENMSTNLYVKNMFGLSSDPCKLKHFDTRVPCGGVNNCTRIRFDNDLPSCNATPSTTKWTNKDITVSVSCNDPSSGCVSKTYTESSNGNKSYPCIDNVGNRGNNATTNITNIDKVKPTCGATTPINTNYYYNTNYGVKVACSDNASKCTADSYEGTASTSGYSSITIYDNAGNSNTCPATTQQFDTSAPTTTITLADGHQGYNGLGHQTSVSVVATISATKLPDINTTNKNI